MNGTTVFLTAIGYVSFLFLIAWWGDSAGRRFASGRSRAFVYALSLAVYCTSWTYYGSVGLASEHGLDFLPIYIGPILVIGLGAPFIARVANLARAQNVTTVADFVSARYGKSQPVAAVAALIALVGSAPDVALQLKAVAPTVLMVVDSFDRGRLTPGAPSTSFYLAVSFLLALFAMAFGTRRINPKEHQDGLILAIAVELIVKLVAFLAVGAFVVWRLNNGIIDLTEIAGSDPKIASVIQTPPDPAVWVVTTLLSAFAIVLLPRQFHVAVVENHDERALKIRITARRGGLCGSGPTSDRLPARVAAQDPDDYSAPRYSERSAARLAHQSGGLGVPSSNLGAPTILSGRIVACQRGVDQPAAGDEFTQHEPQRVFGSPAGLSGRPHGGARHNRRFAPLGGSTIAGMCEQRRLRARVGNVFNETLGLIIRNWRWRQLGAGAPDVLHEGRAFVAQMRCTPRMV